MTVVFIALSSGMDARQAAPVVRWALSNRVAAQDLDTTADFILEQGIALAEATASRVTSGAATSTLTSVALTNVLFMTDLRIERTK